MFSSLKKQLFTLFTIGTMVVSFVIPRGEAKALTYVLDQAVLAQAVSMVSTLGSLLSTAAQTLVGTNALVAKEYILDPAVSLIGSETMSFWSDEITNWVTQDEGSGVGFVNHLETQRGNKIKKRAGQFLERIENINLCSPDLKFLLKFRLQLPKFNFKALIPQFQCTITIGDVTNFYEDFNNGGWEMFIQTNFIPNDNPFMLSYIAEANDAMAQADAADAFNQRAEAGKGFQGVTEDVPADECELDIFGEPDCFTEQKIHTPGSIIGPALEKTLEDNGFDKILSSDELSELLTGMIDTAVKGTFTKLMSGAVF